MKLRVLQRAEQPLEPDPVGTGVGKRQNNPIYIIGRRFAVTFFI